jgi:hypothetical protein
MHGTSARHGRGEVLTGAAVESARWSSAVSEQEGAVMESGRVPAELLAIWERVYREYLSVAQSPVTATSMAHRQEMSQRSADVARVWRDMAAIPGLEWWLVTALTAAAEAYEQQARDFSRAASGATPRRPAEEPSGPRRIRPDQTWFDSTARGNLDQGE